MHFNAHISLYSFWVNLTLSRPDFYALALAEVYIYTRGCPAIWNWDLTESRTYNYLHEWKMISLDGRPNHNSSR